MAVPVIDPRGREQLLEELARCVQDLPSWKFRPGSGELGSVLGELYSYMLADTVRRLNRTPEKHRLAFLNARQTVRMSAHSAETPVVFTVVKGWDQPVPVPDGTSLSAKTDGEPVVFRTVGGLTAIPGRITDLFFADSRADCAVRIGYAGEDFAPFDCRPPDQPGRGRHLLELRFPEVLRGASGMLRVSLRGEAETREGTLGFAELADPARFQWSVLSPGGALFPLVAAVESGAVTLCGAVDFEGAACALLLELLDSSLCGLALCRLHAYSLANGLLPDAVVCGDRELDPEVFFPFGNPMTAYRECLIFCAGAMEMRGAEVTVSFDLSFSETEEQLPEAEEKIDYKWIMKRPHEKRAPEVYEARTQRVDWEYWNGKAFRALICKGTKDVGTALSAEKRQIRLVFDLPDDLAPLEAGGRTGCFLRLCWNGDNNLFRLPRRVFSPRVERLRFSYCYLSPQYPLAAEAWNFGARLPLALDRAFRPFLPPPCRGAALFLGFDSLPSGCLIQLFFHLRNDDFPHDAAFALMGADGEPIPLIADDLTQGLSHSGLLSLRLPERVEQVSLFGLDRYWLRISPEDRPEMPVLLAVYLNAQRARNWVRYEEEFPLSQLSRENTLQLSHGGIVRAKISVLRDGAAGWELWREYPLDGSGFRDGYYCMERQEGIVAFPEQIHAVTGGQRGKYALRAAYEVCDGERANMPAGTLNRMRDEIPFIASVTNVMPVINGSCCETDAQLARRAEHLLYSGGRAVTEKDYELLAADLCPMAHRVRCVAGRPVGLAILLNQRSRNAVFAQVRRELAEKLEDVGCGGMAGTEIHIFPAVLVPLSCEGMFACPPGQTGGLTTRMERLEAALGKFLDPITGGARGEGWEIGTLPALQQIASFLAAREPELTLIRLTVTARGGGASGALEEFPVGAFMVPTPGKITLEVEIC